MIRTQIQLTERQARVLRASARQRGVSLAEMIRRCVDRGLAEGAPGRSELYARAAQAVGRFRDRRGARDLARNHDRYLDREFE